MATINKIKLIVIVGPTATGKSDLAVWLAKKFNGEIVSADSRQVYRGMDIGTGKITKVEMSNIPHHLLDIASPRQSFSVARFQKMAKAKIREIVKRGKLPILCGGTGFYIQSIIDDIQIPEVKADLKLRKSLSKKSTVELLKILQKLDPRRAKTIERKNKVRLIRAIEIARALGKVPKLKIKPSKEFAILEIGLFLDKEKLNKKIEKRLQTRIEEGMIEEVKNLNRSGISWRRLENFGLEYRFVAMFLQKKLTREEVLEKLLIAIRQYARRQMTWFKKDQRIIWINPKDKKGAEKLVKKFLS